MKFLIPGHNLYTGTKSGHGHNTMDMTYIPASGQSAPFWMQGSMAPAVLPIPVEECKQHFEEEKTYNINNEENNTNKEKNTSNKDNSGLVEVKAATERGKKSGLCIATGFFLGFVVAILMAILVIVTVIIISEHNNG